MLLAVCFLADLFVVPIVLLNLLKLEGSIQTASIVSLEGGPDYLEIKIDMALPYGSEWDAPKKGNGLLEKNGEFYTLVERNYKNDTLYFKYIKNTNAREIFSLLSDKVSHNNNSNDPSETNNNAWLTSWMFLKFKANEAKDFKFLNITFKDFSPIMFSYAQSYLSILSSIDTPPPRFI